MNLSSIRSVSGKKKPNQKFSSKHKIQFKESFGEEKAKTPRPKVSACRRKGVKN